MENIHRTGYPFFPEFDIGQWRETEHEQHKGFAFTLWTLKK